MAQGVRPEFPLLANEGCDPGARTTMSCPTRMECFVDEQYAEGGRCDCNPLWFKIPGKLPFDDLEWDDGFTASDCENHNFSRLIVSTFQLVNAGLILCFIFTDVVIIRELNRVKALKWNAATYSLFFLLWAAVAIFFVDLIYIFNFWDLDRKEYWYMSRTVLFTYALMPANVIIDFEIGVTWIDLYDRTNKMSKSTSRYLKVLRYALRTIAFIMSFGFIIWVSLGGILNLLVSALMPSVVGMIFIAIGGHLIVKTLCPDVKDVRNSNWKVAASIRRAVKHGVGGKMLEIMGLVGMGRTSRDPFLGYTYGYFNALFFFAYMFRMWAWLHYLIYSSRKHLKKYKNKNASAYFGFATIGGDSLQSVSTRLLQQSKEDDP
eukprot:CAMPEP_0181111324 /NCGR_PEP_ID=MMETSP1071-20121207/19209_1 /TAXON_ID=35127 /ORGANISM="Thalassiosira sp., Strain NH16" /LENGTH=375 /DNA_ID=CAMNT_0023195199 /DNA_START=185 /DNA_END=1312 /DNA_ORIENTATION=-